LHSNSNDECRCEIQQFQNGDAKIGSADQIFEFSYSMKHIVWGLVLACVASNLAFATDVPSADVLDRIALPEQSADGGKIKELSGLGWDEDEKLLYAVGDNGYLHHFKIGIAADKFVKVEPVYTSAIADSSGGLLSWDLTNAEGLDVRNSANGKTGDSELLIAFEDGPTIGRFTPKGQFIAEIKLPAILADTSVYLTTNKRLESVSEMAPFGVLTAPEAHLTDEPDNIHSVFAMDGHRWRFPALQTDQDSVKAIDPLPDGRLLFLIRTRDPNTDEPQAHLRIVDLSHCGEDIVCPVTDVVVADPKLIADDFEGMTSIGNGLYLVVTDSRHGGEMVLVRLKL
jgi:Esterase-like activity of phytase